MGSVGSQLRVSPGYNQGVISLGSHPRLRGLMISSLVLAEFFTHDCLAEIPFFLLAIG